MKLQGGLDSAKLANALKVQYSFGAVLRVVTIDELICAVSTVSV